MKSKVFLILLFSFLLNGLLTYAQSESVSIVLLRHSEKAAMDGQDPDLSPRGKNYALALKTFFSETKFDAAFSTPYKRTRETIQQVAESNHLVIRDYKPFDIKGILQQISNENLHSVIVAAHGNTINLLVNQLVSGANVAELDESDYGKIFIVNYFPDNPHLNTLLILNTQQFLD